MRKLTTSAKSPFRSASWIASAGFVGALAVLAIVFTVQGLQADSPGSGPAASATPSVTRLACPPSSGGDLSEAGWTLIGSSYVPTLAGVGPSVVESDGFRRCFASSPAGAVMAAANYVIQGSMSVDARRRLAAEATVPGPGRDAAIAAVGTGGSTNNSVQIAAYRIDEAGDDAATITIVVRTADGRFVQGPVPLRWFDGDWKLVVDPLTGSYTELSAVPNLGGTTPWSAGS